MTGVALFEGTGKARRATPNCLARIEQLASEGRTVREMAPELGITSDNLSRVIKYHPAARDAWERGKNRKSTSPVLRALVRPGRNGRPIEIKPAGLESVTALASRGVSQRTIASQLGITKKQLEAAIEADPAVHHAYEQGRAALEEHVVRNLIKLSDEGSVAATIFACKNFAGMSDDGPRDQRVASTNVQILLNGALSREAFMASITTEASDARNR
jgi:hypothetical protein